MVATTSVTNTIKSLRDLQERFGLRQTDDLDFFPEWVDPQQTLTTEEEAGIESLKRRYDYQRTDGLLLEGTINVVVVSPLMVLAGFLDPPFRVQSPYGITLELEDPEETIRGFIDVLVVQQQLWVLVIESKRTSISVPAALPQLLAYMLANPQRDRPTYGLATNGDEFVFLKLQQDQESDKTPEYDVSRSLSLFPRRHELGDVLKILKRLGQEILKE